MTFNDTTTDGNGQESVPLEALTVVEIEKTSKGINCIFKRLYSTHFTGFGFNIVGGTDNPHFVGDIGIYVSSVNSESKSYGVVRTGDKILSVSFRLK